MKFKDPILQSLVKKYPAPTFVDKSESLYENLIESIVSQQLSIKAADTIFGRFKKLFESVIVSRPHEVGSPLVGEARQSQNSHFPSPSEILAMEDQKIRNAGISFQKISYIKSVADAFVSDLIDIEKIKIMSEEEIITALTQIRGVGKWTAEMILIFTLNRPDVFSLGDLGIRNAITRLYGITDQKEMLTLSEKWKPYRSTACWYLWRSLENTK